MKKNIKNKIKKDSVELPRRLEWFTETNVTCGPSDANFIFKA